MPGIEMRGVIGLHAGLKSVKAGLAGLVQRESCTGKVQRVQLDAP